MTKGWLNNEIKRVRDWYKNHIAVCEKVEMLGATMQVITWAAPDTGLYAVRYMLISTGTLIVQGDLGSAVYQFSNPTPRLDLEWLADTNFNYFHGKCQASEVGKQYNRWTARYAREHIMTYLNGSEELTRIYDENDGYSALENQQEWIQWLDTYASDMDCESLGLLSDVGIFPDCRAIGYWVGLQMAYEQTHMHETTFRHRFERGDMVHVGDSSNVYRVLETVAYLTEAGPAVFYRLDVPPGMAEYSENELSLVEGV